MNKTQKSQQVKLMAEIDLANARLRPGATAESRVTRMGDWEVTITWRGSQQVMKYPNWDTAIRHFEEESQGVNQMQLL